MDFKRLIKDYRIIIWLIMLLVSIFLLIPKSGVVVKSVDKNSPFYGEIGPGEKITWINEKSVKSPEDIYKFSNYHGKVRMIVDGRIVLKDVNGFLGIEVEKERPLKFGLDIGGGVRAILKPKKNVSREMLESIRGLLLNRVNLFGLKEVKTTIVSAEGQDYIFVEIAGGSLGDLKSLLEQKGVLEGKISKIIRLDGNKGILKIGGKSYEIKFDKNGFYVNNTFYKFNQSFYVDDIKMEFVNKTDNRAMFFATVFVSNYSRKDIKSVCMVNTPGVCTAYTICGESGCRFSFEISITREAAERVKKVLEDETEVEYGGDGTYLNNCMLYLFLDGKLQDEPLKISSVFKEQVITQVSISGGGKTREDAEKQMRKLQAILSSGSLPVELEIESVEIIPPKYGEEFLKEVIWIGLLAELVVVLIVFLRYRNIKIAIPMIVISFSEVIIILGIAALIGWTIDMPSLAGIIAIIGTGVDDQIVIIDEFLSERRRIMSIVEKIKRAFFIIFSSAATTFVAMLPLISSGAKLMQGFAVTTLIGLAIAVFVTRPAFGKFVEEIVK